MTYPVVVVGIGADGWDGLSPAARREIESADVLMGSARQLALVATYAEQVTWPSPLLPALPGLLAGYGGRRVCVLASGDPMFHGIGSTLVRILGRENVRIVPSPSSVSLACARMGWPVERTHVVSAVGRPLAALNAALRPGERLLVLGADPARVAELLINAGYGESPFSVLELLGAPGEHVRHTTAAGWAIWGDDPDPLNIVAVECLAAPGTPVPPRVPGLPDDSFDHDGQLTKREVRAVTLGLLGTDGILWDIGAGAGSIAIEWLRAHPTGTAIAIERDPARATRIADNAESLGTPALRVLTGSAPDALTALTIPPTTIFVGGGLTTPGLLDQCWTRLSPGGRLVANAVTLESEAVLTTWYGRLGGDLLRLSVSRAAPIGAFTTWRPHLPVTIWSVTKPSEDPR
ncbi:precorrin-6Y C5,15-methyltransferase (decarboxylating) [Acrocarpospora phusangensis]|uniref:Precorrin-6Y C5,15-methyltransferase (Decarboxylating) n=1 Tax=Acrocarpospora phusangensis TaxID=1070424 RepID=A0A919UNJ9_9ACTN|nr:precorrin-6y C5,15-methyltransferase (decarboxylating) subunit CbiE [Acrocarpospora phusangensis]GIH28591.1 precorrin-6Y C5,15-methyltransferase (decarboxylating) [Acrocarpospora phusangensis]